MGFVETSGAESRRRSLIRQGRERTDSRGLNSSNGHLWTAAGCRTPSYCRDTDCGGVGVGVPGSVKTPSTQQMVKAMVSVQQNRQTGKAQGADSGGNEVRIPGSPFSVELRRTHVSGGNKRERFSAREGRSFRRCRARGFPRGAGRTDALCLTRTDFSRSERESHCSA